MKNFTFNSKTLFFIFVVFAMLLSFPSCFDMYSDIKENSNINYKIAILESTPMETRLLIPDSNKIYSKNLSFNPIYSGSSTFQFSLFGKFTKNSYLNIVVLRIIMPGYYYPELWTCDKNFNFIKTDLTYIDSSGLSDAIADDFDNNGMADIAIVTGSGYINRCFLNIASPENFSSITFGTYAPSVCIASADFDNDGYRDIFAGTISSGVDSSALWKNDIHSSGTFQKTYSIYTPNLKDCKAADFDNDGRSDIVLVYNGGPIQVLFNSGNFSFNYNWLSSLSYDATKVAVADLNGDNLLDLYLATGTTTSIIAFNNGDRTFTIKEHLTTAGSLNVALADFDGDGDIDLFLASAVNLSIYKNDSNGNFALSQVVSSISGGPHLNLLAGAY
ncbi:MAG TPA: VCBS repeat-containing protein [Spirochaetota bacterium]|nr:VCBS repeat-containing protein [Spirochaetota bacterium]